MYNVDCGVQQLDTSSVEQHFDHSLLLNWEPEELRNHFRQLSPPSEIPRCIFHTGSSSSSQPQNNRLLFHLTELGGGGRRDKRYLPY